MWNSASVNYSTYIYTERFFEVILYLQSFDSIGVSRPHIEKLWIDLILQEGERNLDDC